MGVHRFSSPVGRPSGDLNQGAAPTVWRRRQEVDAASRTSARCPSGDWSENWARGFVESFLPLQTAIQDCKYSAQYIIYGPKSKHEFKHKQA